MLNVLYYVDWYLKGEFKQNTAAAMTLTDIVNHADVGTWVQIESDDGTGYDDEDYSPDIDPGRERFGSDHGL